ncbi:MAG: succinate dehydrogenase assembly factor 2 [Burkholderiaceae bacterium]|jgi:antitoxin CptB|nr:succinate dehydrogenase assembly factor 2 [Burkholderiaceae bacterium]
MATLTELERARLRWRARRGLLENDLIFTRFLDVYEESLTDDQIAVLALIFELGDNELLDLLLGRIEPSGKLDQPAVRVVLKQIQELKIS